jgi:hypothetical protein
MKMTAIAPISGVSLGTGSNGYFPIRLRHDADIA